jgi:hypothetical protein
MILTQCIGPPDLLRTGGLIIGIKRHKPEVIASKLRQVEVLVGQGIPRIDAIRPAGENLLGDQFLRHKSV